MLFILFYLFFSNLKIPNVYFFSVNLKENAQKVIEFTEISESILINPFISPKPMRIRTPSEIIPEQENTVNSNIQANSEYVNLENQNWHRIAISPINAINEFKNMKENGKNKTASIVANGRKLLSALGKCVGEIKRIKNTK